MPLSIAIVCEAAADARTVRAVAERLLIESCDWIPREALGDHIQWRGFRATDNELLWRNVQHHARELDIVTRLPKTQPPLPYSFKTYQTIQVLGRSPDFADGIIMIADSDNDPERVDGLRQGRDMLSSRGEPSVVGVAHTKRECWHIAGFSPSNTDEEQRLAETHAEIQFDPTRKSHKLTGIRQHPLCPKRVLTFLTQDNWEREMECLQTPFPDLEERGSETGLPEFLNELRTRLLPVFGITSPGGDAPRN